MRGKGMVMYLSQGLSVLTLNFTDTSRHLL